jgi:hypothetical protein
MKNLRADFVLVVLTTIQVQGFCFCLLSKNVKIKTYETIVFLVVTLGTGAWPFFF